MKSILMFILCCFISSQTHAGKVSINKIEFKNKDNFARVKVHFDGILANSPEVTIRDKIIQVSISDAIIWPQVKRNISLVEDNDAMLMGYQFDKEKVRVRIITPFELEKKEDINIALNNNFFEVYFPIGSYLGSSKSDYAKKVVKSNREVEYDKTYLNYLLEQEGENLDQKFKDIDSLSSDVKKVKNPDNILEDIIQITQSSSKKSDDEIIEKKSFDVMTYIGKYIAFLGLILLFIYGLVFIFRKNILKKRGLGIFGNTDLVSVLSTTHIGPKRSLLLVKVHKKVILLGNSESGVSYLSELDEISNIFKEGEEKITGSNFDTTIDDIDDRKIEKRVKIKDDPLGFENNKIDNQESSLSEQIKKRIKDLRPLQ